MQQKLILSVYLLINPSNTNDTFHNGNLSIFICPQYQIGTSSTSHMSDLNSLTQDSRFDEILNVDGQIKPIWILLVDGDPDENPHHMKIFFSIVECSVPSILIIFPFERMHLVNQHIILLSVAWQCSLKN